jgi:hypothetical protein
MKPVIRINRDTLITTLLVVAGIVLALALFGAGVLWRSKPGPTNSHLGYSPVLNMLQKRGMPLPIGLRMSHGQSFRNPVR